MATQFRPYTKQPRSTADVLQKLQTQGLGIADLGQATQMLDRVSYFQLKEVFEHLREDGPAFPATSLPKSTVLDKMAQRRFGASHFRELANWVHVLRDVRNICAHHGRLWNKNLIAASGLTAKVSRPFPLLHPGAANLKTNTVYGALIVMRVMTRKLGITDGIRQELERLFTAFPEAGLPNHLHAMGMPPDWDQDALWV